MSKLVEPLVFEGEAKPAVVEHVGVLTRLNGPTLARCRQIIRRSHAEYFYGVHVTDWQCDQLIEALGEEVIRKLLDNAQLAGLGPQTSGAGGNEKLAGGKFMDRFVERNDVASVLRGRDPDA